LGIPANGSELRFFSAADIEDLRAAFEDANKKVGPWEQAALAGKDVVSALSVAAFFDTADNEFAVPADLVQRAATLGLAIRIHSYPGSE
jgi:hypothetical protein